MSIFSFLMSLISFFLIQLVKKDPETNIEILLLSNKYINDITTVLQVIGLALFSILHFRTISSIKEDARQLYFELFDRMSNTKDFEWLTCRTLHVSGIAPNERNSN